MFNITTIRKIAIYIVILSMNSHKSFWQTTEFNRSPGKEKEKMLRFSSLIGL
jgi:hypothetical protein